MNVLAQMGLGPWLLGILLIVVCGFLIIVILLQRGRGGGLAGAFGGTGGSSAFGAKTGDVFTWITVIMAMSFLVLAVVANFVFDQSPRASVVTPATAAPVAPELPSADDVPPITVTPIEVAPSEAEEATQGEGGTTDLASPPEGGGKETPGP